MHCVIYVNHDIDMHNYDTLSEATKDLKKRGYTRDFYLTHDQIECKELDTTYAPSEFSVEEYYRFEGTSNPGDMSVVYAIKSNDGEKGILVDAFGTYSDTTSPELLAKLKLDPHNMNKDS